MHTHTSANLRWNRIENGHSKLATHIVASQFVDIFSFCNWNITFIGLRRNEGWVSYLHRLSLSSSAVSLVVVAHFNQLTTTKIIDNYYWTFYVSTYVLHNLILFVLFHNHSNVFIIRFSCLIVDFVENKINNLNVYFRWHACAAYPCTGQHFMCLHFGRRPKFPIELDKIELNVFVCISVCIMRHHRSITMSVRSIRRSENGEWVR